MLGALSALAAVAAAAAAASSQEACSGEACYSEPRGSPAAEGAAANGENLLLQLPREAKWQHNRCTFAVDPETPYYWDPNCTVGGVGCWADGVHPECRFCLYEGVQCPRWAWRPSNHACRFKNQPMIDYYFEPRCPEIDGGLGCKADGKHQGCRFCGGDGNYSSIECPAVEVCTFLNEPQIPYFYDETCTDGGLGCMADGIHAKCRFCGARPYESIQCPPSAQIPETGCWFRNEPAIPYYWDDECRLGVKGCWADGIHAKCRFCSKSSGDGSPYSDIPCK